MRKRKTKRGRKTGRERERKRKRELGVGGKLHWWNHSATNEALPVSNKLLQLEGGHVRCSRHHREGSSHPTRWVQEGGVWHGVRNVCACLLVYFQGPRGRMACSAGQAVYELQQRSR